MILNYFLPVQSLLIAGWIFFTGLQLTDLYGAYPWNNGNLPGPTVSALYAGTSKTVWAMGIFWVLFVCCTGNGGESDSMIQYLFLFVCLTVFLKPESKKCL